MIKIFGHSGPDTDATCSALIWQWYLTQAQGKEARAFVQDAPNSEAAFVLQRWDVATPPLLGPLAAEDEVVIVDTNNPGELPDNINEVNISEIIDHHMLAGGLSTQRPIKITIRPVAATATVMHWLIGHDMEQAPDWVRGLMLSCILSDTLEFRSPTTTPKDREIAQALAEQLEIDIPTYAAEMFAAKSDVSNFSDTELLTADSKLFDIAGKKLRVSVLETTAPDQVLSRKAGLIAAMPQVAAADGADAVLLFVVDILNEESTLLIPDATVREIAAKSFGAEIQGDTVVLPGIMSRKKQIIPALKV